MSSSVVSTPASVVRCALAAFAPDDGDPRTSHDTSTNNTAAITGRPKKGTTNQLPSMVQISNPKSRTGSFSSSSSGQNVSTWSMAAQLGQ